MSAFNSILVLSNPFAGNGRAAKVTSSILQKLKLMNLQFHHDSLQWPDTLENYTAVFLIGGDGTLNYFINKYKEIAIPIAAFKGGSGNDFAWKLYGDLPVSDYFDLVLSNSMIQVDAGRCNDRFFLNGFGIGFDGAIVQAMAGKSKLSAGPIGYLYTVLKKVLFFHETTVSFIIDDKPERHELPFLIAIANGERYGGGFKIAPGAILNDGKLDMILIKQIAPWKRIFKIPMVQKGKHLSLKMVEHGLMEKIIIKPHGEVSAHCDGELIKASSFQVSILKGKYTFFTG
jgi:diacylglycerol kinase (ATP)